MFGKLIKAVFGTKSDRDVRRMRPLVEKINRLEVELQQLDEAALKAYAVHPAHQEVANTKVRPFTAKRLCLDF